MGTLWTYSVNQVPRGRLCANPQRMRLTTPERLPDPPAAQSTGSSHRACPMTFAERTQK